MATRGVKIRVDAEGNASREFKRYAGATDTAKDAHNRFKTANDTAREASKKFFDVQAVGVGILQGVGQKLASIAQGALSNAVDIMKQAVSAAAEQELQEKKLLAALNIRSAATEEDVGRLLRYAGAIQQTTGVADEFTLSLASQLSALGIHKSRIEDGIKMAIAWSHTVGKDMRSAAIDVSKAMNGNINMIRRYNSNIQTQEEAMDFLMSRYELVEGIQDTLSVQTGRLSSNYQDLIEQVGILTTKYGQLAAVTGIAADATLGMTVELQNFDDAVQSSIKRQTTLIDLLTFGAIEQDKLAQAQVEVNTGLAQFAFGLMPDVLQQVGSRIAKGKLLKAQLEAEAKATEAMSKAASAHMAWFGTPAEIDEMVKRSTKSFERIEKARKAAIKRAADAAARERERELDAIERALDREKSKRVSFLEEMTLIQAKTLEFRLQHEQLAEDFAREQRLEKVKEAAARMNLVADEANKAAMEKAQQSEAVAKTMVGHLAGFVAAVRRDSSKVGQAFSAMVDQIVSKVLANLAWLSLATLFSGGTAGFFAKSGAALGIGKIAGEIFGFHRGGVVPPQRFSDGGEVRGGVPNTDSVPALLTPGEMVIPKDLTDMFRALMGRMNTSGFFASGGVVAAGGAPTINIYVSGEDGGGAASDRGIEEKIVGAIERMNALGRVNFGDMFGDI